MKFLKSLIRPFVRLSFILLRIIKSVKFSIKLKYFRLFGRRYQFTETSKAKNRREKEGFFKKYCQGKGIDMGYNGDLVCKNAIGFDIEHGDATYLEIHQNKKFDFIYSSHLFEHLSNPQLALKNWWKLLNKNGFLIIYLPHRDLYEKNKILPSKFNPDHKYFYLIDDEDLPDTLDLKKLVIENCKNCQLEYAKVCDDNYLSNGDNKQSSGEYSIEIIIKKLEDD